MRKIEEKGKRLSNPKNLFFKVVKKNDGFGLTEIIAIAAVLIVAAFVTIPGLRAFGTTVLAATNTWWTATALSKIFPTT